MNTTKQQPCHKSVVKMKVIDCKCSKALVLPVGRRSMKGFPTIRPATRLGNEVALHKTSVDVSPESHQLISYAQFKITKAVLAAQGLKGQYFVLSHEARQDKGV